jgi:hypothetical protein
MRQNLKAAPPMIYHGSLAHPKQNGRDSRCDGVAIDVPGTSSDDASHPSETVVHAGESHDGSGTYLAAAAGAGDGGRSVWPTVTCHVDSSDLHRRIFRSLHAKSRISNAFA